MLAELDALGDFNFALARQRQVPDWLNKTRTVSCGDAASVGIHEFPFLWCDGPAPDALPSKRHDAFLVSVASIASMTILRLSRPPSSLLFVSFANDCGYHANDLPIVVIKSEPLYPDKQLDRATNFALDDELEYTVFRTDDSQEY